jgi:hypothetical protein
MGPAVKSPLEHSQSCIMELPRSYQLIFGVGGV